jgi:hypothetical protein
VIALQITDLPSRQRGRPTKRGNEAIVKQIKLNFGHGPRRGLDIKTSWLTDRQLNTCIILALSVLFFYVYEMLSVNIKGSPE